MLGLERDLMKVNQRRFHIVEKDTRIPSTLKVVLGELRIIVLGQGLQNMYYNCPDTKCFQL